MASKAAPNEAGQSDFFPLGNHFFCSFLGSLFDHFLTKFWTTFGCLFGCLLGAFSGLLKFSWEASGSKNTKKLKVFQGFWKCSFLALWSSWWLSWAHLAPSLADLIPKWAPKLFPKMHQKRSQDCPLFFFANFWEPFSAPSWKHLKSLLEPKMDQGFCTKFLKKLQEKPRWAQEGHHEL